MTSPSKCARARQSGSSAPPGAGKARFSTSSRASTDPRAGSVLLDGRDLRDLRLADVYAQMALVTQDPFLFSAPVRDNIRVGRPDATHEEVEAAARSAFVHDEIVALPQGYDTPLGVDGRELSGGQRQRLTVARALLANAPLLLLDEATSSLDSVAESEVQRAIDRLMNGRTSFVVAHRLSTLRHADRILVLDRGRVAGFATHAELLRTCLVYRRLWDTQQNRARRPARGARRGRVSAQGVSFAPGVLLSYSEWSPTGLPSRRRWHVGRPAKSSIAADPPPRRRGGRPTMILSKPDLSSR